MKHLLIIPVVAGLTIASMSFTTIPNSQTSKISNLITTTGDPEVKPEYPGGMDALIKFMTTEVKFPKNLEKENIEGKVFVKFQVNEKGEVENISIAKSSGHDEFDNEAKRVVAKMPNWNPAKKDGKNVSAEMTLPFTFQLAD